MKEEICQYCSIQRDYVCDGCKDAERLIWDAWQAIFARIEKAGLMTGMMAEDWQTVETFLWAGEGK